MLGSRTKPGEEEASPLFGHPLTIAKDQHLPGVGVASPLNCRRSWRVAPSSRCLAADRANRYFNARATRIDDIVRVIDRNGGAEKIYQAVMGGVTDGSTTLRGVIQSLPEEGQKAVTAAGLLRVGLLANPGAQDAGGEAFSAAAFLTNWNMASPEARRALLDRYGQASVATLTKSRRYPNESRRAARPSRTRQELRARVRSLHIGAA